MNISIKAWTGGKNFRFTGRSEVTKPKKVAFQLDEMVIPVEKLVDGQTAMIQITMLNTEEQSYRENLNERECILGDGQGGAHARRESH